MRIFAVFVDGEIGDKIANRIEELYSDRHFRIDDNFFLIASDELTDSVSEKLLEEDGDELFYTGVVFSLNGSYAGYETQSLWDWLELHGEAK